MWNPDQYSRYSNERSRPFFDLLAQVHLERPRTIVDLGCGSGELTATLAERWPEAHIIGVDNSPEMIERARQHAIEGRLAFEQADLASWKPEEPLDLIVSNAALQWVGNHERLLPELAGMIAPGGVLAFQVPGNFNAPSHVLLGELMRSDAWHSRFGMSWNSSPSALSAEWYLELLKGLGLDVTAWETSYMHILQGDDPVLEWVKGTALRPVLATLDEAEQQAFLQEYGARLREAYPQKPFGTVFPFRRIFVVARQSPL